jgi:hypothetical protein
MQKETVYFSIHREFTSEHPDVGGNWHYVGRATVTDHQDSELPEIDIERLYMAADPHVGCLPSTYISADPNLAGFVKSKVFQHIEMACLDLFAADSQSQESQEAESICNHFDDREKVATSKGFTISVSEIAALNNSKGGMYWEYKNK